MDLTFLTLFLFFRCRRLKPEDASALEIHMGYEESVEEALRDQRA